MNTVTVLSEYITIHCLHQLHTSFGALLLHCSSIASWADESNNVLNRLPPIELILTTDQVVL
jgi:hypothetical protein